MSFNETIIRVRYGETDQMGVVYHANYAVYFEVGRTEWLRKFGLSYKAMEAEGILLPVISLSINYKNSARYDDVLTLQTRLKKRPTASIEFDYELRNDANNLLATGKTKLVFMNKKKNKPMRCPKYLLDKLQNYSL